MKNRVRASSILWFSALSSVVFVHSATAEERQKRGAAGDMLVAREKVNLATYFERLETVRNAISALPAPPANTDTRTPVQLLEDERADSIEAYRKLVSIFPPDSVATTHFELLNVMEGRANVYAWIRNPLRGNATEAQVEEAQYRTPEVGQFRRRLEELDCELDRVATANGLTVRAFGTNCNTVISPRTEKALGSSAAPVSTILLTASGFTTGADGQAVPAPDLDFDYSVVYAKAGPITLTFDNQNPTPFRHNAVVYRNATGTGLLTSQRVAGTPGGAGPSVSTVQFTLEPGNYSIVCNVHLELHMTRLVVVP